MKLIKLGIASLSLAILVGAMAGCSTDENPVSPQKMEEIRQKEADERANFKPGGMDQPKPGN